MRDGATGQDTVPSSRGEVLGDRGFALFWGATSLRSLGEAVSGVAVQVVIVGSLAATPGEISVLTAVGVVPYLFLGLLAGAWMDRRRRRPVLIVTSVGRALVLLAIPVLLLTGALTFWSLAIVLLVQGVLTLLAHSAEQPLLPRLVPRRSLVVANARLAQSDTIAGTAGPAAAGALLGLIGAPVLLVVDALVNAVAALLQSRIRVVEAAPVPRAVGRHVGHDVAEGLRYTYGHRTLRPLALSVHTWFLGNSIVATVFAVFVLRHLELPPWAFGVALTAGGVGGFLGALVAPRIGARLGPGRAILLARTLAAVPWLTVGLLPLTAAAGTAVLLPVVAGAQLLFGLSIGVEDANDTGYRQSVAPDGIQGRMNATIRTVNRAVFLVGALLAGVLVTTSGFRVPLVVAGVVFAAAALVVLLSPLRAVRWSEPDPVR